MSAEVDVGRIRQAQAAASEFAARFGIAPGTLRDWEQKRKRPEGPARVLLMVIEREPAAVERAIRASTRRAA